MARLCNFYAIPPTSSFLFTDYRKSKGIKTAHRNGRVPHAANQLLLLHCLGA